MTPSSSVAGRPAATGAIRWTPVLAFGLLLLGLSRQGGLGIGDPDTLWHVLAGRHLARTWDFAGPDPLSSFTHGPWILHQWLPDLALAAADRGWGLPGVVVLAQVARLGLAVSAYWLARQCSGTLPAALVGGTAVLGSADALSPRPQVVGLVLLAVTVGAWWRTTQDLRPRWWLLAIGWLWACCHGSWVLGVAVGGLVVAGLVLDRRVDASRAARLAAIPVGGLVLGGLTPVGPRLFESLWTVRAVSPYIQEWQRPALTGPSFLAVAALVVVVLVGWLARRRTSWVDVLLLVAAVAASLWTMRTVSTAAILLVPLAATSLEGLLRREPSAVGRAERTVVWGSAGLALLVSALLAVAGPSNLVGVPSGLDGRLRALPAGTVVYDTDLLGGWLYWSHPHLRPTADTRVELYGPVDSRTYLRTMAAEPGWEAGFDQHHPTAALVPEGGPLSRALVSTRGWQVLGHDDGYVLLVPPA